MAVALCLAEAVDKRVALFQAHIHALLARKGFLILFITCDQASLFSERKPAELSEEGKLNA